MAQGYQVQWVQPLLPVLLKFYDVVDGVSTPAIPLTDRTLLLVGLCVYCYMSHALTAALPRTARTWSMPVG